MIYKTSPIRHAIHAVKEVQRVIRKTQVSTTEVPKDLPSPSPLLLQEHYAWPRHHPGIKNSAENTSTKGVKIESASNSV
jgi:hypothetical protein